MRSKKSSKEPSHFFSSSFCVEREKAIPHIAFLLACFKVFFRPPRWTRRTQLSRRTRIPESRPFTLSSRSGKHQVSPALRWHRFSFFQRSLRRAPLTNNVPRPFFLSVSLTNPGPFQKQRSTRAEVALCGVDCILSTHANNEEEETLLSLSLSSSNTDIYQRYNQSIIPESSL